MNTQEFLKLQEEYVNKHFSSDLAIADLKKADVTAKKLKRNLIGICGYVADKSSQEIASALVKTGLESNLQHAFRAVSNLPADIRFNYTGIAGDQTALSIRRLSSKTDLYRVNCWSMD